MINALNYLLEHENRRGDWLPDEVDLSFASERWLRVIYDMRKGELMLNRRHFEVCVFTYLAAELKTGDISIAGSDEYADYREQLLPYSIRFEADPSPGQRKSFLFSTDLSKSTIFVLLLNKGLLVVQTLQQRFHEDKAIV